MFRAEHLPLGGATLQSADLLGWIDDIVEAVGSAIPSLAAVYANEIRGTAARRQLLAGTRGLVEALERDAQGADIVLLLHRDGAVRQGRARRHRRDERRQIPEWSDRRRNGSLAEGSRPVRGLC